MRHFLQPVEYRYPLTDVEYRREHIKRDKCPECGGGLDTGWECNSCYADLMKEALTCR